MGPLSVTTAFVIGTFLAGVTFDMGVNALQDWYHVLYQDAFWGQHPIDTPALRDLAREEREIDRLVRMQDFVVTERAAR